MRYFPPSGCLQRTCFLLGGSAVDDGDVLEDSSTRTATISLSWNPYRIATIDLTRGINTLESYNRIITQSLCRSLCIRSVSLPDTCLIHKAPRHIILPDSTVSFSSLQTTERKKDNTLTDGQAGTEQTKSMAGRFVAFISCLVNESLVSAQLDDRGLALQVANWRQLQGQRGTAKDVIGIADRQTDRQRR